MLWYLQVSNNEVMVNRRNISNKNMNNNNHHSTMLITRLQSRTSIIKHSLKKGILNGCGWVAHLHPQILRQSFHCCSWGSHGSSWVDGRWQQVLGAGATVGQPIHAASVPFSWSKSGVPSLLARPTMAICKNGYLWKWCFGNCSNVGNQWCVKSISHSHRCSLLNDAKPLAWLGHFYLNASKLTGRVEHIAAIPWLCYRTLPW